MWKKILINSCYGFQKEKQTNFYLYDKDTRDKITDEGIKTIKELKRTFL